MRRPDDQPRPAATPRDPGRLLTPGLAWLLLGLALVLGLLVAVGVAQPASPDPSGPWADLLISLVTWAGAVLGLAGGAASAAHGLLLQGALDRHEAVSLKEAAEPPPRPRERGVGRAVVAALGLLGGLTLAVGVLLERGPSPALLAVAVVLVLYGLGAGVLAWLARLTAVPSLQERARWRRQRDVALTRPLPHLHLGLLILLTLTAVGLQLTLIFWVVEDAAISFAYARHLAAGEGLVTFPGGERVEGYSNPLWTFLIAAFYVVGVHGFISNKVLAAVFAAVTVPLTWAIAREARPHRVDAVPLLAAALLAGSAQFAIWGAGGLENSLLNVLIAAAIWRALVEARRGGVPWSALLWLGVALTRPEGILYAAAGGFWSMVFRAWRQGDAVREAARSGEGLGRAVWSGVWPTLAWLGLFFVPFGAYHAWRYSYFAWELPNTYYAKKANPAKAFEPFTWTRKGWKYLKDWAHYLAHAYLVPVYMAGMTGTRGLRSALGGFMVLAMVLVLVDPDLAWVDDAVPWRVREPDWWVPTRVFVLAVGGLAPAFLAIGRPGWRALSLCLSVAWGALFFAVYAGGDWMSGYRWMATFTVPGAVVLAVGIGEIAQRARVPVLGVGLVLAGVMVGAWLVSAVGVLVPPPHELLGWHVGAREPTPWVILGFAVLVGGGIAMGLLSQRGRPASLRWGPVSWALALSLLGLATVPSITRLDRFLARPTTSPWKVKRRAEYMNAVQERLHLDGRPTTLDVDMGAIMYWSGDRLVDIAGLVDVPMAHHWFDRPFIARYIFEEQRPHFAHVHGGWARTSKLKTHDAWKDDYLEIPPYPVGARHTHPGNHIRKDLVVVPQPPGPETRATRFETGLILEGWDVPAGQAAPGRHVYVELAWSTVGPRQRGEAVRVWVFLADPAGRVVHSWEAPPGFDYYAPSDWRPGEVVAGRYSFPIGADVPLGTYDLGIAVVSDPRGEPVVALGRARAPLDDPGVPNGAILDPGQARLLRGEIRWPGAVTLVSAEQVDAAARREVKRAVERAAEGACDEAERAWWLARRAVTRTDVLVQDQAPVERVLATCWAERAVGLTDRGDQVEAFAIAHAWDHHAPALVEGRVALVERLLAEGAAARATQDWAVAYAAFRDVLRIDPQQAWARRWSLEALDCSLRIRLDEHDCGFADEVLEEEAGAPAADPPARPVPALPGRPRPPPTLPEPGEQDTADGAGDASP